MPMKTAIVFLLTALIAGRPALAQPSIPTPAPPQTETPAAQAPEVPAQFTSPRATMMFFLDAMARNRTVDAAQAFDIPDSERDGAAEALTKLVNVLNRIGRVLPTELPDEAKAQDLQRFNYFPHPDKPFKEEDLLNLASSTAEISLARGEDGAWRFTSETYYGAAGFYSSVEDLPLKYGREKLTLPMRIRRAMPAPLRRGEFLGVEYWQWIGLFGVLFVGVLVDFTLRFFLAAFTRRLIARRGEEASAESIKQTVRPFGFFFGALAVLALVWLLGMPPLAMKFLLPAIRVALGLSGIWAALRVADLVSEVLARRASGTRSRIDDLVVPLGRKAAKLFIIAFGLIYLARSLNIDILPMLTGLGIGGLAVAFAAKDTIENFFGSVAVIADHPFEVGDWIEVDGVEGTVEDLGFRSTRIRTFYNSLVTVPNATLVRAKVDNYGRRRYRRWRTHLGVAYGTAPDTIEALCEGIRELIRLHPYTRKDYFIVNLHEFAAASLNILIYTFHETPDWQTELRERQRLMLDILRLCERMGVEIAFPTQTIYVRNDESEGAAPAEVRPGADAERASQRAGREAVRKMTSLALWRKGKPAPMTMAPDLDPDTEEEDDTQIESKIGGDG